MFPDIQHVYPRVAERVRQTHLLCKAGHHDFLHDERVANLAIRIAHSQWGDNKTSKLAGLSGLCHSADRHLQAVSGKREVPRDDVSALVHKWLDNEVNDGVALYVVETVLAHDGKNSDQDTRPLIALMDADRVVNMALDVIMRAGQHYPGLPPVDRIHWVDDPAATYRDPKSVLRDVYNTLDWVAPDSGVCVRTCLGRELAYKRAAKLRRFIDDLRDQLTDEEGVLPFQS